MAKYRCKRCNYLYIEENQDLPFDELNDENFKCPRCRCSKRMFECLD